MNAAPAVRLPVIETVLQTYDLLAKHFLQSIVHYIAIVLVIFAICIVTFYIVGEPQFSEHHMPPLEEWLPFALLALSLFIPQTIYFVALMRLGANNRVDRNHVLGLRWWGRETCVLLRTIWICIVVAAMSVPLYLVIGLLVFASTLLPDGPASKILNSVLSLFPLLALICTFYFMTRFYLYSCSPALDERIGLWQSWRLTRGNGWRIVFVTLLLQAPIIVANLVLDHALDLQGTFTYAVATGVLTILWIMFVGFGSAIVYRSFVPPVVAAEPATNAAAR